MKYDKLLIEVNAELEEAKQLNPVVAMGINMVKEMILKQQDMTPEDNAVNVTITVDDRIEDVLGDWSNHLANTLKGYAADLSNLEEQKRKPRQVPAEFMRLISPDALLATMDSLDLAITAEAQASDAKEASYGNKGELLRQKLQLETSIKLTESEAMGKVLGVGKEQYVNMSGEKLYLTNDQSRDAYRRMASKDDRAELARINGELGRLDVDQFKTADAWYGAKGVADSVGKKASLQSALLNFLAGRG